MKILIVEDDRILNKQISELLQKEGYIVDQTYDGEDAQYHISAYEYDLIVLDLGLPKVEGLEVLKNVRGSKNTKIVPIIILTARGDWHMKVRGLNLGADDYMVKPFVTEELLARIRALIRRSIGKADNILVSGQVRLNTLAKEVFLADKEIILTKNEFMILEYLLSHKSRIISKSQMEEHIYNNNDDLASNTIEVFIKRLRDKLGKDFIKTHRGIGYKIA